MTNINLYLALVAQHQLLTGHDVEQSKPGNVATLRCLVCLHLLTERRAIRAGMLDALPQAAPPPARRSADAFELLTDPGLKAAADALSRNLGNTAITTNELAAAVVCAYLLHEDS